MDTAGLAEMDSFLGEEEIGSSGVVVVYMAELQAWHIEAGTHRNAPVHALLSSPVARVPRR